MNGRLTLEQTAHTLGVSERTLRRHIAAGKIAAIKDTAPGRGGAWFFDASTVRALLPPTEEEEQKEDVPLSEEATPAPSQADEIALLNERLDVLGHEHALLKQQMAQVLERLADEENNSPRKSRSWWPSKREA